MPAKSKKFYRWITIGADNPYLRTLKKCRELGIGVFYAGKPGMVAWYGFGIRATTKQRASLEAWWSQSKIKWFNRMPQGAWAVEEGPVLSGQELDAAIARIS